MQRLNAVQWATPAGMTAGTPEAEAKLNQTKHQFGNFVLRELTAKEQLTKMQPIIQNFQSRGQETPQELKQKFNQFRNAMQQAQEGQKRIAAEQETLRQAGGQQPNTSEQAPQIPQQPTQASPTLPPTSQAMNTGNSQNRPPQSPAPQQTPTNQQSGMSLPQQQTTQNPGQQQARPGPFNVQPTNNNSNSPQTQVPPGSNTGSTQSYSHQSALAASQAARTQYPGSNPPSASAVAPAGSNPPSTYSNGPVRSETQMNANPKMPIPKHLNTTAPTPVTMGPGRPTLAGVGSGPGVQGVMGQPVMQKAPGYTLEGDGEHVLSRKKLDELVRQVTGAEGPGAGLSQDCEEVNKFSFVCEFLCLGIHQHPRCETSLTSPI